jgi:crotonobetainyl-CoA:carnitine CoA-transferase CaiB-like acyl-CoA transferase
MLLRKVIVLGVPISAFPFLVRSGLDPAARAEMIVCRRAEKMAMHGRFDKASPDGLAVRARAGGQPPKDRPRSRTVGNSAEKRNGVRAVAFPRASKALARFTVLDLTRVRAGPTCARQLADWGANVIKIEAPPDSEEPMGGPRDRSDFLNLHRNKRSVALNLKAPEGLAAFKRLVKKADVLIENFRPAVKERLGIDYKTLRKINPRLVYASISGFGQDGPYADRPGFDQIAQGMGGLMSITGLPGQGPVRVGIPVADLTAGLFAALGILTALLERDKSGKGQAIETSLLQAQIFMLDFQAARYLVEGEVAEQAGNNHPTTIPTSAFKTSDGYINIATTGGKMWERFCQALGAQALLDKEEYRASEARLKHRDALNAAIEGYLQGRTSAEWVEHFNKAGVPCGPIYSIDQVFADPQVKHLGIAKSVNGKAKRKLTLVGQPVSLSRTPSHLAAPPPKLGEHTDAVLKEFGFSKREIKALHKAGAA